jgi:hypothetical protein
VAEQLGDAHHVDAAEQELAGEGVVEAVRVHALFPRRLCRSEVRESPAAKAPPGDERRDGPAAAAAATGNPEKDRKTPAIIPADSVARTRGGSHDRTVPATERLSIRYRYPRPQPEPETMDPWHVHGSAPLATCGSLACEAAPVLAARDRLAARIAGNHGEAAAMEYAVIRPGNITMTANDDGTIWMRGRDAATAGKAVQNSPIGAAATDERLQADSRTGGSLRGRAEGAKLLSVMDFPSPSVLCWQNSRLPTDHVARPRPCRTRGA